jgi:RecB family exonuclease
MGSLATGSLAQLELSLASQVAAAKGSDPLARVTVVVGSGHVAASLPRTLARLLGGYANVRVVTLWELARELAAASGLGADQIIENEALECLVDAVMAQTIAGQGGYFAPVAAMPGLRHAFRRTLTDLREAGVTAAASWGRVSPAAAEVRRALHAYEDRLSRAGVADRAGVYDAATRHVRRAGGTDARRAALGTIFVYGLYDLPQCQRVLLAALADAAPLSAFVPLGERGSAYAAGGVRFFVRLGLPHRSLAAGPRSTAELVSVGNDEDEAVEVARRLQELVAAGARYHEIAVVAPSEEGADHLARRLLARGVPVARRLPLAGGSVARVSTLLQAAFPAKGPSWSRAAVIAHAAAMATSHPAEVRPAEVALWTDESRRARVVAGADWQRLTAHQRALAARCARLREGQEEEDDDTPLSAGALAQCERRAVAVTALQHFVERAQQTIAQLPQRADWPGMAEALTSLATGHCGLRDDDLVVRALADLRRCGRVQPVVTAADAARYALARLSRLKQPSSNGGVAVLTPYELRCLRFPVVLFTGLSSGSFPAVVSQDPLLNDQDRRHLADHFGVLLADAVGREQEPDYLFELARQAAGSRFVALVPRRDASGKERQPSRLAIELAEELGGKLVVAEDLRRAPVAPGPLRRAPGGVQVASISASGVALAGGRLPADQRDLDVALLLSLHGASPGVPRVANAPRRYLEQVCGSAMARRLLGRRLAGASGGVLAWDGVLRGRRARRAIAAARLFDGPLAPTALQEYLRCPFAYYVLSVLRIQPTEDPETLPEADQRDLGIVAHEVLRRVFEAVSRGASKGAALAMVPTLVADECLRAQQRGRMGLPLAWQARQAQLTDDLLAAVGSDPCWSEADGPQPWRFELPFGNGERPVVLVLADGTCVGFRGRIDRLDRSPSGQQLRVLDYKTGKGETEKVQVDSGRNIQLPVYLLAARALVAPQTQASITCSFRMVTRRGSYAEVVLPADENLVGAGLADTVSSIRRLVMAGVFPRLPADAHACAFCRLRYACDELQSTMERKRGQAALGPLAQLRMPAPSLAEAADV